MFSKKLSRITLLLTTVFLFSACTAETPLPAISQGGADTEDPCPPTVLAESEDRGQSYLDSFVFFGESTTYHMINRGVLKGGKNTSQVWGPDNGTVNLDTSIASLRIRYPETGEYLTLGEAAAQRKPPYLVLTFGLNGAVQNVKRGKNYYQSCYHAMITEIRSASPHTKIILQSCFPVAKNMDMTYYSVTVDELNDRIDTINGWVLELAEREGLRYLNTAEILKDKDGRLIDRYQSGDGHHLTREAYVEILHYIRTHGYE